MRERVSKNRLQQELALYTSKAYLNDAIHDFEARFDDDNDILVDYYGNRLQHEYGLSEDEIIKMERDATVITSSIVFALMMNQPLTKFDKRLLEINENYFTARYYGASDSEALDVIASMKESRG